MARTLNRKLIVVTLGAAATPITTTPGTYATDFEVYFPSANVGLLAYIGNSAVNNTWIPRQKQQSYNFVSGTGSMASMSNELGFDLSKIYILGTNADKAIVEYMSYSD